MKHSVPLHHLVLSGLVAVTASVAVNSTGAFTGATMMYNPAYGRPAMPDPSMRMPSSGGHEAAPRYEDTRGQYSSGMQGRPAPEAQGYMSSSMNRDYGTPPPPRSSSGMRDYSSESNQGYSSSTQTRDYGMNPPPRSSSGMRDYSSSTQGYSSSTQFRDYGVTNPPRSSSGMRPGDSMPPQGHASSGMQFRPMPEPRTFGSSSLSRSEGNTNSARGSSSMHSSAATDSASAQESTKLTKEIQKLEKQMAKLEVAAQKNETKAFVRLESQVKILEKKSALTKDANVKAEYTEAIAELRGNYEVWVDEMHLRVQDALDAMEMELDRKKDRLEEVQEALEVH